MRNMLLPSVQFQCYKYYDMLMSIISNVRWYKNILVFAFATWFFLRLCLFIYLNIFFRSCFKKYKIRAICLVGDFFLKMVWLVFCQTWPKKISGLNLREDRQYWVTSNIGQFNKRKRPYKCNRKFWGIAFETEAVR